MNMSTYQVLSYLLKNLPICSANPECDGCEDSLTLEKIADHFDFHNYHPEATQEELVQYLLGEIVKECDFNELVCEDCGQSFDINDGQYYVYEPDTWLCTDCHDERMAEDE